MRSPTPLVAVLVLAACRADFDGGVNDSGTGDGDGDGDGDGNLLANPGFEEVSGVTPTSWSLSLPDPDQTGTVETDGPHQGERFVRLDVGGTPDAPTYGEIRQYLSISATAGTTFEGGVWIRCASGCDSLEVGMALNVDYGEDGLDDVLVGSGVANDEWKLVSGIFVAEHDVEGMWVKLTAANGSFDYDAASLIELD